MKETYQFYDKCIEEQGYCCPYCGSENIHDWEKSRNYRGAGCENPDCPYIVSWKIIDIGKDNIDIEELEFIEKSKICMK